MDVGHGITLLSITGNSPSMPFSRYSTWIHLIGFSLMGILFCFELLVNMPVTVAYIALAGYTFWLAEKKWQITFTGLAATLFLLISYILIVEKIIASNQPAIFVNRVMSIIVIWFAYYFTLRYRKTREDELRQRNEIQERKLEEERLRSSQEMYRAIARNFPEGWIGILNTELTYVFADGKGLDRFGINPKNLIGKKFTSTVKAEEADALLRQALRGNTVTFEVDFQNRTWEVNAGLLFHGQRGKRLLIVVHDITTLKRTEGELIKALEKEKELGELKSRFVTLASHEFRTPLTTILSSSFLLESYTGEKYEREKATHIGRIKRSVKILTEMLNDFLSLGRLEEGEIKTRSEEVDLREFLEELVKELESLKRSNQVLKVRHTGQDFVITDKQLVRNIIYNLASNAFKYTHHDDEVCVDLEVVNNALTVRVTDHGMGIPPEEQNYIFKRFYRAQNVTNIQGTGLGLNIVRKYVNLLNGSIEFSSNEQDGTVFTVTIPVHTKATFENVAII
jgi:PAS domain S-box-containing protein